MQKTLALAVLAALAVTGTAEARDQIRIVGSSTVYPFTTVVAEQFGRTAKFKTPVIESTGTGGGFKLFCAGVGVEHPDVTNASRAIKKSELENCKKNGVTDITEVKIGYDGIVVANSKAAPQVKLTREQIFLALAKNVVVDGKMVANPNQKWSDIEKSLPDIKIEVLGPPPTSGTRDAFVELVMDEGCKTVKGAKEAGLTGKACGAIREDGGYVEAGENDVLIVRKLEANKNAFGVFGYSFLDQNADKIQGSVVEGVEPTFDNIAKGTYAVSRPLFFYVKKAHVGTIPGMKEFVTEFTSEKAWGMEGYLADKGLIPMPDAERKSFHDAATSLANNIMM
ncbi:MAG: PstS family phosphate ABC transporter substrate-binding protein [Rhodospirillales bacterium]|nr:PstS family phosphate ABC transporter substrate-binding protein [Rhodospirillales bacterium]